MPLQLLEPRQYRSVSIQYGCIDTDRQDTGVEDTQKIEAKVEVEDIIYNTNTSLYAYWLFLSYVSNV